jgi:hypothetical protein
MSRVNRATVALSIGPSARYTLFLVFVHILLLFTVYVSSDTHMHIYIVTYITVIFWIKLKLKMHISLTVCTRLYIMSMVLVVCSHMAEAGRCVFKNLQLVVRT